METSPGRPILSLKNPPPMPTDPLTNKQKRDDKRREKRRADIDRMFNLLSEMSPTVFNRFEPKPLAVGIREAIRQRRPDLTAVPLRNFLAHWCTRRRYHMAVAAGGSRYNLDGEPVDLVTETAQANARNWAKRRGDCTDPVAPVEHAEKNATPGVAEITGMCVASNASGISLDSGNATE